MEHLVVVGDCLHCSLKSPPLKNCHNSILRWELEGEEEEMNARVHVRDDYVGELL